ncbi:MULTISPECIES: TPM domain-containing protein [Spirulina sp. CCY15215]|uniref:photosystem II repair protein Psb32 n=1 Tax=Spirulina sp. CCY15215 TaxID=2767591 RepID=UPI00194F73AA|nr:TPM domain-containing protein [Spirulina major]
MNRLLAKFAPAKSTLNRLILGLCTVFVLFTIAVTPAIATTIYELPNITGQSPRAIDAANVLSPLNEGNLNKSLEDLATKTGKDVWLVTVRIGYGDTVEEFTDALFNHWFPTPEAGSDRLLLVLDTLSNNSAIHAGEGLQALLTDDIAQSIAQETLLTPIRTGGKYNQAFLDAQNRLFLVLSGEADPGPPAIAQVNIEGTFTDAEETDDRNATVWVIGFLVVATIVPMLTYYLYVGFPGQ